MLEALRWIGAELVSEMVLKLHAIHDTRCLQLTGNAWLEV